jgi:hypothetical protein
MLMSGLHLGLVDLQITAKAPKAHLKLFSAGEFYEDDHPWGFLFFNNCTSDWQTDVQKIRALESLMQITIIKDTTMKTSKRHLLVIPFLISVIVSSYAQIPNYPIDDNPSQTQPSVAVSPTHDWLLGAAWNYLPR